MAEGQELEEAVESLLKAVIFENWLRFHFIREEAGEAGAVPRFFIQIPDRAMARIRDAFPQYLHMAEKMNAREVNFQTSRAAILGCFPEHPEGAETGLEAVRKVLASPSFQQDLELFNAWLDLHEAQLDAGIADFGAWLRLFSEWRTGPAAKKLLEMRSKEKGI